MKTIKKKLVLVFLSLLIFSQIAIVFPGRIINPQKLSGNFNFHTKTAFFNNKKISPFLLPSQPKKEKPLVLGQTTAPKRIEIDLTNQRLYAYEGNRMIYNFLVSTGRWHPTPTGRFHIWIKLRYCLMKGGSKILHTYYYLPNVPYVMYFYNWQHPKWEGYGIHGTYWHHNFGHPMSHGCINMKTEEAGLLYYWAQPDLQGRGSILATDNNQGTEVIIYGQTPRK